MLTTTTTGGPSTKNKVRELRVARGWSALALADAAETLESRVYSIERGRHRPHDDEAIRLARALDKPVEIVFPPDRTDWRRR